MKALSDLIALVAQSVNALVSAPKPLTIVSLELITPLIPQILVVAGEIGQIPSEIGSLDVATAEALIVQLSGSLNLGSAKATAVAAASLELIKAGFDLASALKLEASPAPVAPAV